MKPISTPPENNWHNVTDPQWEVIANAFKSYTIDGAVKWLQHQGYLITKNKKSTLFTERELEISYCIGLLNQKDFSMETLAEQLELAPDKFELLKKYILNLREEISKNTVIEG